MPLAQSPLGGSIYDNAFARKKGPALVPAGDTSGQVPNLASAPMAPSGGGNYGGPSGGGAGMGGPPGGDIGFGIQPPSLGSATARWASWAPPAPQKPLSEIIKAAKIPSLSANPQLPQHPLGAYTDSQYEADNAVLEQQINAAYQDILSQTGYDSPTGQGHIAGDVELQAARQERDQNTGLMNAVNNQVGEMQQAGTIFSGYNATTRAAAESPFIQALGDLAVDTPRTLTRLYQQAEDLMRQYAVSQNQLLMSAAQRRAAALAAQLAASGGGRGAGGAGAPEAAPVAPVVPNPLPAPNMGLEGTGYTPYVEAPTATQSEYDLYIKRMQDARRRGIL